jgi:hypothetical protein
MEGEDPILNLAGVDFSYFEKSSSVERKDGLYLDQETLAIINELTENKNPFGMEFSFDESELSGSKIIRAGVKFIKENPGILALIDEEIGVENL